MPEFIVHVSVELADSMVEEKLRYTTNKENQTYTIGEAATLSKDSYVMFGTVLAQLAEFCMENRRNNASERRQAKREKPDRRNTSTRVGTRPLPVREMRAGREIHTIRLLHPPP